MQKKENVFRPFLKRAFAVTLSASLIFGMEQIPSFALATAHAENVTANQTAGNFQIKANQSVDQSEDQTLIPVEKVEFVKGSYTITEGTTAKLEYKLTPANATAKNVTWTSSDDSVVHVDKEGTITGLKAGKTASITVVISGKPAICLVTVEKRKIAVESIEVTPEEKQTVNVGETLQLSARVSPENATDKSFTWEVTKGADIVSVDANGLVTAKNAGDATVTAKATDGGLTASCEIKVENKETVIPLEDVAFDETEKVLLTNQKYTLIPRFTPVNATNQEVTWKSEDESIATVDETGVVTTLKAGTTKITASSTDGVHQAILKLTVEAPVIKTEGVKLVSSSVVVLSKGKTASLTYAITPEDATNKSVTVKSSKSSIAKVSKVDEKKGTVTFKAVTGGYATITITSKANSKLKQTVKVIVKPDKVSSLKMSGLKKTSAKATWKKTTGASGYEINVYNKKTNKLVLKKTTSKTGYAIGHLKKASSYKVRVRAYIKVSGQTEYGSWTSFKTFTTKKK
ncbi:MAG: Ig-like domain-containing protein [Lachnospiraceae bacterium]